MPSHVYMRFSGMGYPLAWQALIDRLLAVGRFVEEGRCRFLKSRMACMKTCLMTGRCTVFQHEWLHVLIRLRDCDTLTGYLLTCRQPMIAFISLYRLCGEYSPSGDNVFLERTSHYVARPLLALGGENARSGKCRKKCASQDIPRIWPY